MSARVPLWSASERVHAVGALAAVLDMPPPRHDGSFRELLRWLGDRALERGFVVESFVVRPPEIELLAEGADAMLLQSRAGIAVVARNERNELLACTAQGRSPIGSTVLAAALASISEPATGLLDGLDERARERFRRALGDDVDSEPIEVLHLRRHPARSVNGALRSLHLPRRALVWMLLGIAQAGLSALGWALLSSIALEGHQDQGVLWGWVATTLASSVVQIGLARAIASFSVRAGMLLRQRFLEGTLDSDPESLGGYGVGGLMALAGQVEGLLSLCIAAVVGSVGLIGNLIACVFVLSVIPHGSGIVIAAFFAAVAVLVVSTLRLRTRLIGLQVDRMSMSTDFVERMMGHRTRLVQQTPNSWHEGEDDVLVRYATRHARVDEGRLPFVTVPRLFVLAGIPVLLGTIMRDGSPGAMAVTLGGLLLASSTLASLGDAAVTLANASVAFRTVGPIVATDASGRRASVGASPQRGPNAFELRSVSFSYLQGKPVLENLSWTVARGEHVLLEGRSGGGKTTVASILAGLRRPEGGLVLVGGEDQRSMTEMELRRYVAYAPQFQRNHVFSASLAFNVLLGRDWPPTGDDLAEAERLLVELDLGPLLRRMPSGIHQHVGESGWQLSHGEKSRVFLSRTLLQTDEVVVLDESFGTLDPETLERCMAVVRRRARTLVVITHR